MTKAKKKNTVVKDVELNILPGDELMNMTPNGKFFFKQSYDTPIAVGVKNGKLVIEAIEKSSVKAFTEGLRVYPLDTTEEEVQAGDSTPVYTAYCSSDRFDISIIDGKLFVVLPEFQNEPFMVKDASITGMLPNAIYVTITCLYNGYLTIQHFKITEEEILKSIN